MGKLRHRGLPGVFQPETLPRQPCSLSHFWGPLRGQTHHQVPQRHFCLPQVWQGNVPSGQAAENSILSLQTMGPADGVQGTLGNVMAECGLSEGREEITVPDEQAQTDGDVREVPSSRTPCQGSLAPTQQPGVLFPPQGTPLSNCFSGQVRCY